MIITTRIKIFLKKNTPEGTFKIIRLIADNSLLKILPYFFRYKTLQFKKRMIKEVSYHGQKFKIIIDPRNGYLDEQVYAKKLYEPHIVAEFVENIKAGNTCIDVGANIGHHAIIMSQAVKEGGIVYAFEPIPFIRTQMEESIVLNNIKNIQIFSEGLSDAEGELNLNINEHNVGASSLVNPGDGVSLPVQLKTLDSYDFKNIDFIKIDVEGFEYNVLKGAESTIAQCHPKILLEYSPVYYQKHSPSDSKNILEFLKKYNYTLIDLEDNKKEIVTIESFVHEFDAGLRSQTNILAV